MKKLTTSVTAFLLVGVGWPILGSKAMAQQASTIRFYGYDDCIRLENETSRVTLNPARGGRVLEYALNGKNVMFIPPGDEGGGLYAGRFDIGPEQTIAPHPDLWNGQWTGQITGRASARLTSIEDPATGVQLIRDFELDAKSSLLTCTQTIKNVSDRSHAYCHWSRTLALGGGICVIPVTQPSRFPNSYVMYEPETVINFRPVDPNIRMRDGFLEIVAAPKFAKLGMDSSAGWFAYVMKNNLMFVKVFPVYPDRVYNEVAGLTISIYYPDGPYCELEPIGPRESLKPGESASFTETWALLPHEYPAPGELLDLESLAAKAVAAVGN